MVWHVYRVVLRLHTLLHVGWGKVSYLQRARPYVTGRVLRGALVSRVARNQNLIGKDANDPYRRVSKTFAQYLTFTYFYPALKNGDHWKVEFPWDNEAPFRRRFLSSYAGTALAYPQQSAAEGLLREIEFISPYTLDTGDPVYLMGYIFVDEERLKRDKYDWIGAFRRLQLGGERGYGWGDVRLAVEPNRVDQAGQVELFGQQLLFAGNDRCPRLTLPAGSQVWAHVHAANANGVSGPIEPMIGREWRAEGDKEGKRKHIGQHLAFNDIRFTPGSVVTQESVFSIGEGGYWQLENIPKS